MRKCALSIVSISMVCGCSHMSRSMGHSSVSESGMAATNDMNHDMQMMNDRMVQHLGSADPDYERRFIDMMIPHHEGAIRMAQDALQNSSRPELKAMAKDIIAAQQKEIAQLKNWRRDWYER